MGVMGQRCSCVEPSGSKFKSLGQCPFVLHVFIYEAKNVFNARGCEVQCGMSLGQVGPGEVAARSWVNKPAEGSTDAGTCRFDIAWVPPARITVTVRPGDEILRIRLLANIKRRFVRAAQASTEVDPDGLSNDMDEGVRVHLDDIIEMLRKGARRSAGRPGDPSGPASAEQWLAVDGNGDSQLHVRWAVDSGALNRGMLLNEPALAQAEAAALEEKEIGVRLSSFLGEEKLNHLNDIGTGGGSALHLALRRGDEVLANKILLRQDFKSINVLDFHNQSVLHYAANVGNADFCTKILARADFLVSGKQDVFGQTALHVAVRQKYTEAALSILRSGVFVACDAVDHHGTTSLHLAAITGDAVIAAALLRRADCTPELPDQFGNTAESLAANKGHFEVVKLLEPRMARLRAPKMRRRGQV